MTAAPGLYVLQPIQPTTEPRLFAVYADTAVLVPIPVVSEQVRQDTEEPVLRVVES